MMNGCNQYYDPTWKERRDILEGEIGDRQGHPVALSGDGKTLAVGAPYSK